MMTKNRKPNLKSISLISPIFCTTLVILMANQSSVEANFGISPSVELNSNFQTLELLVKDLREPSTLIEPLDANIPLATQTDNSENCLSIPITHLIPSSQSLGVNMAKLSLGAI